MDQRQAHAVESLDNVFDADNLRSETESAGERVEVAFVDAEALVDADKVHADGSDTHAHTLQERHRATKNDVAEYRDEHDIKCRDKAAFADCGVHDAKLLQKAGEREKDTAGDAAFDEALFVHRVVTAENSRTLALHFVEQ